MSDSSVTNWIEILRSAPGGPAQEDAVTNLWKHYFQRLSATIRSRVNPATRRVYDEEDAAQSAFYSVCAGIQDGRFPDLADRDSLWRLLLAITGRKISHRHRFDHQERRDVRRVVSSHTNESGDGTGVDQLSSTSTPEFVMELEESVDELFARLGDAELKVIATLKMQGYTDTEVAESLHSSRRTVQRRLEIIRRIWTQADSGN